MVHKAENFSLIGLCGNLQVGMLHYSKTTQCYPA